MSTICDSLRIGENHIEVLTLCGNHYIPYIELMELIFTNDCATKMEQLSISLADYTFMLAGKNHVTMAALPFIFRETDDEKLKQNIMSQLFQVKLYKPTFLENIERGLKSLQHLETKCTNLYAAIGQKDIDKNALMHELERSEDVPLVGQNLKDLLVDRRKMKWDYKLLNLVKTNLDKYSVNYSELGNILNKLAEIKFEIEESKIDPVYFKRDGSNRQEMDAKIKVRKEKFKRS